MSQTSEKNVKLNLLKAFACISVVFVHVRFPGVFGQITSTIAAFAVPIFYMVSGYFAWGKSAQTIQRRMLKICKIFLLGYLLYFVYGALVALGDHSLGTWLATNFNWKTPIKYILFCTIDFAVPLWYLIALIEVYILWYLIVKLQKEQLGVKLMPGLFALQILLALSCDALHLPRVFKVNFLTQAMPWFLLGYFMHTDKAKTYRALSKSLLCLLAGSGFFIALLPLLFPLPQSLGLIGYIPYAMGLFALALKEPNRSVCKSLEYVGEKLSLHVYLLHEPVAGVLSILCANLLKVNVQENLWLWLHPVLTLICTALVAWLVHSIAGKTVKSK